MIKVIEMNEDEDYKIITVFRSQQPDQFHIPRPHPNWDYAETYESLIKESEELKSLIIYVSTLEEADEESAERLLNEICFLSFRLQDCCSKLYSRFLKDKIIKATPPIVFDQLGIPSEEDINYH